MSITVPFTESKKLPPTHFHIRDVNAMCCNEFKSRVTKRPVNIFYLEKLVSSLQADRNNRQGSIVEGGILLTWRAKDKHLILPVGCKLLFQ